MTSSQEFSAVALVILSSASLISVILYIIAIRMYYYGNYEDAGGYSVISYIVLFVSVTIALCFISMSMYSGNKEFPV